MSKIDKTTTDTNRLLGDRLGATLGLRETLEVAIRYGDPAEELDALHTRAAFVDRSWIGRLRVRGDDRLSFLQRYATQDVAAIEAGSGGYGFITNPKGGIVADFAVLVLADELWIELPPAAQTSAEDHFAKYALFDQVEFSPLEDFVPLAITGPQASDWLAKVVSSGTISTADSPSTWAHRAAQIGGIDLRIADRPLLGAPTTSLWVARDQLGALIDTLDSLPDAPIWAGWDAFEALRIGAGEPRHGIDYGDSHFPQETGRENQAVSYTKGCYLGQEVVARIHYRGRVNRILVGLAIDGEAPSPGTELRLDGRAVGAIGGGTTWKQGTNFALAIVHRKAADADTLLSFAPDGEARVVTLPIDPP